MSREQFSLIGCRECLYLWIVEDLHDQNRAACPRCEHERQIEKLREFATADEFSTVAEVRARKLAARAGCAEAYAGVDHYAELDQQVEEDPLIRTGRSSGEFDSAALDPFHRDHADFDTAFEHVDVYETAFADAVDTSLERHRSFFENAADDVLSEHHSDPQPSDLPDEPSETPPCLTPDTATGEFQIQRNEPVDVDCRLTLTQPIMESSQQVIGTEAIQSQLVEGLEQAGAAHGSDLDDHLQRAGVSALLTQISGGEKTSAIRSLACRVARGQHRVDAWNTLRQVLTELGGNTMIDLRSSAWDILTSYPRLFAAVDPTPTIHVSVDDTFWELTAEQRRTLCYWLSELAHGCDVYLTGSYRVLRKLNADHREALPEAVSEWLGERRDTDEPEARAEVARGELKAGGPGTALVKAVSDEATGRKPRQLAVGEAATQCSVSESRVRQFIANGVEDTPSLLGDDLSLLEATTREGTAYLELTDAGEAYLNRLYSDAGVQQTLEEAVPEEPGVSDPQNSSSDRRVNTRTGEGGGSPGGDRHRLPHYHEVQYRAWPDTYAAAGCGPGAGGDVTVIDHPIEPAEDRAAPKWGYDEGRDRLVVSTEGDNPVTVWTCIARALADRRTFEEVIPPERMEDNDEFMSLFADHRELLRESRCLGHLPDEVETPEDYAENLMEAEQELANLTGAYHDAEPGEQQEYAAMVIQNGLGLYGIMVHLLDLMDVQVVVEVRLPTQKNMKSSSRESLCRTLTNGLAIGSRYGHYTAFRQLLEQREEKEPASEPDIDMEMPFGEVIPSFVVVGQFSDERGSDTSDQEVFIDCLKRHIDTREDRDDAPEFAVPIEISKGADRSCYAAVVQRMCSFLSMRVTSDAIDVCRSLTGSPYDAARALYRLSAESGRQVELDEVRTALATLPAKRLMPSTPISVGKLLKALLEADEPFESQAMLASEANVSEPTVRKYRDTLVDLGWLYEDPVDAMPAEETTEYEEQDVKESEEGEPDDGSEPETEHGSSPVGWRLALPFYRGEEVKLPGFLESSTRLSMWGRDYLCELLLPRVDDAARLGDPNDSLGAILYGTAPLESVTAHYPDLEPWIPVLQSLEPNGGDDEPVVAMLGTPSPQQQKLPLL